MSIRETVYVELPLPPSVNSIWQHGKGRTFKSKTYTDWQTTAGWSLRHQLKGGRVPGPIGIQLKCVRPDARKRDIDNLIKAALDLLVCMNVIDDDSFVQRVEASWVTIGAPLQILVIATKEVGA